MNGQLPMTCVGWLTAVLLALRVEFAGVARRAEGATLQRDGRSIGAANALAVAALCCEVKYHG